MNTHNQRSVLAICLENATTLNKCATLFMKIMMCTNISLGSVTDKLRTEKYVLWLQIDRYLV